MIRTKSSLLLIAILALLACVAVWFSVSSSGGEDWDDVAYSEDAGIGAGVGAGTGGTVLESGDRAADDALRQGLPDGVVDVYPARGSGDVGRTALGSNREPSSVAREHGFPVRVVDRGTKAPVAGAAVYYYDTLSPRYRQFRKVRRLYQADKEEALTKHGEFVLSNESGVAYLPHGIPTQSVAVRHESRYGEVEVSTKRPPPEDGYVVEIAEDRTLRVLVVDEDDNPVSGVHLAFYIAIRDDTGRLRWTLWRDPHRDVSSTTGIQRLPHVQVHVQRLKDLSGTDPIVHIGIDIPGLTRCGPAIDIEELPEKPVKVVMRELGTVVAQVVDGDEMPVRRRVRLSTEPDFPYPDLAGTARAADYRPRWERETDELGRVVFEKIAVGTNFRIESIGANVSDGEVVELRGPSAEGQEIAVTLIKDFTAVTVEGVAVDAKGARLVETDMQFAVDVTGGDADAVYLTRGAVRTDDVGRFRLRLAPTRRGASRQPQRGKGPQAEHNVYAKLRLEAARARGEVAMPARLTHRRYDVGKVKLALPELIASGRVYIDDEPAKLFDRFTILHQNRDNENRWEKVTDLDVYGRDGGHFEIRGEYGHRKMLLRPRAWWCLPIAPIDLVPGRRDIEIRLQSAGILRAAVLHDIEAADAKIEVKLEPVRIDHPTEPPGLKWRFVGRVDKRNSGNQLFRRVYWWTGLPPGTYRVELRLLGSNRPFMVLDGLHPSFGERLESVPVHWMNLRGAVHRVKIRAVDGKGRALAGIVFPLNQTALETMEGVQMTRKGAVLHTTQRGVNAQVVARGYRPENVFGVERDKTVRLRPGFPVTVTLPRLRLPEGVSLRARIVRRTFDYSRRYRAALRHPVNGRSGSRPLTILMNERNVKLRYRGNRQWKTTLMEHGQFRLLLELRSRNGKSVRMRGYGPSLLIVRDTPTEHEFTIKVNQRRLLQSLEELGLEPVPSKKK